MRSGRRRLQTASDQQEVDVTENPTELFRRINSGDWNGAIATVHRSPSEARIWVSRCSKSNKKTYWKYLPLHIVCLHQQPPWPLIEVLLQAHPQAASTPTHHDGNLPIHYACESGCDDVNVLEALIKAFPTGMTEINMNNKTPMMVCHPRTRTLLKKLLKQKLPQQLANLSIDIFRNNFYGRESESSGRGTFSSQIDEQRQLPDGTSKDCTPSPPLKESPKHKSMTSFTHTSNIDESPALGRYFNSVRTPKEKEPGVTEIRELTGQFDNLFTANESSELKLCERILAKAESESVCLRAQIQQLQIEKKKLEEEALLKDGSIEQYLVILTKALSEQADKSRITLFQQNDDIHKPSLACITEAFLTFLSHVETKTESLKENIKSLQTQLSETEVKCKTALACAQVLEQEKSSVTNERSDLEALITSLEDENESLKKELCHEKERSCSLSVINHSLQEQVDLAFGDLPGSERNLKAQLRHLSAELLKMKEDKKNCVESKRYQKQISCLLDEQNSLRERNRTLKETIRENSQHYSAKIMELEKKFEAVEQSNEILRLKTKVDKNVDKII